MTSLQTLLSTSSYLLLTLLSLLHGTHLYSVSLPLSVCVNRPASPVLLRLSELVVSSISTKTLYSFYSSLQTNTVKDSKTVESKEPSDILRRRN